MFYRLSGIFHTKYTTDRQLWTIKADRYQVFILLALAVLAPLYLSNFYLSSYLLPWLVFTSAALSLMLLMGIAGQLHFGFAAVMAIGAYTSIHLTRLGVPFEISLIAAGVAFSFIWGLFGSAALRGNGFCLVFGFLGMEYIVGLIGM